MLRTPLIGASRVALPSSRFVQAAFIPSVSRTFTTTVPRCDKGNKVVFDKTSNEKLDNVLTTMLHNIILPARLPKAKLKFVSNAKNAQKLETDPIVIEVDDYEHQFGTLDYRLKELPASWPLFKEAVDLMSTREDWANLVRILNGYAEAGRRFKHGNILLLIDRAGTSGNIWAVVDALRRTKESGLGINTVPRADAILYWVQRHALDSGFARKETEQAKTWSLMLRDLMEDDAHRKIPSRDATKGAQYPLHREPQIIGQVLNAVATHAALHQGGQDTDGKVAELAELLVHLWPQGKNLAQIHDPVLGPDATPGARVRFMRDADGYLVVAHTNRIAAASYILNGVRMAQKVVEPGLSAKLEPIAKLMEEDLAEFKARKGEQKAFKGWSVHDKLFPEQKVEA